MVKEQLKCAEARTATAKSPSTISLAALLLPGKHVLRPSLRLPLLRGFIHGVGSYPSPGFSSAGRHARYAIVIKYLIEAKNLARGVPTEALERRSRDGSGHTFIGKTTLQSTRESAHRRGSAHSGGNRGGVGHVCFAAAGHRTGQDGGGLLATNLTMAGSV